MREAPSIQVMNELMKAGEIINAYDPIATEKCKKVLPCFNYICGRPETSNKRSICRVNFYSEARDKKYEFDNFNTMKLP